MKRTQLLRALGAFGTVFSGAIPARVLAAPARSITLRVTTGKDGKKGPDGHMHDAFTPANFTIPAGVPVAITVVNADPERHSMTCAAIPLDQTIEPAKKTKDGTIIPVTTKFTITARPGTYRWYCKEPCDMESTMWSMGTGDTGRGEEGYMAGHITAV